MDRPLPPLLAEALRSGLLTDEQARDCVRIASTLDEVDVSLDLGEIAVRKGYLTKSQVQRVRRAVAGFRVGKYAVERKLGEGGSGVVWQARDVTLDRLVALKILSNELAAERPFRERFLREARVAVTLNHVRIVRGLDYGEADGYHFFAMELVEGTSLRERLEREGRLEEADAFRVALQVVEALRYVQDFGLVHRDIKPGNVLLTGSSAVKLCDLGLAKPSLEEAARLRHDHALDGTPHYMAPEQVRDPHRVDWRADVYSLGATLFHALTGEPPFTGTDRGGVIQRQLTEAPRDPRENVLSLSAGAAAVTLKMLSKDPSDRYATLDDLDADLSAVVDGRPPVHTLTFAPSERPLDLLRDGVSPARALPTVPWSQRVAVVGALVLVVTGLGLGAYELLGPGAASRSARQPAPSTDRSQPMAPQAISAGTSTPPAKPDAAADTARAAVAWSAFEEAARRAQTAPDDFERQRREFLWVVEQHAGTPAAEEARARVAAIGDQVEALAADELAARQARADAALVADDLAAAWRALEGFPARLAATAAARTAEERATKILERASRHAAAAIDRAKAQWAEQRFAAADAILSDVRPLAADIPAVGALLADATLELAEARQGYVADRAAQRPLFVRIYRELIGLAGIQGVRSSLARVDQRLESQDLSAYKAELEMLRADLEGVARLRDAVRRSWSYRSRSPRAIEVSLTNGEQLRGVANGVDEGSLILLKRNRDEVRVRPLDLDAGSVREVTRGGGAYDGPYELDLFRLVLAAGDIGAARVQAEALVSDPPAHAGATNRLAWVREVLETEVQDTLALAREHVAAGELSRAEALLRDAATKLPDEPAARVELGALQRRMGELDKALATLRVAVAIPGCPALAHLEIAHVLKLSGESESAVEELGVYLERAAVGAPHRSEGEELLAGLRRAAVARQVAALVRRGDARARLHRADAAEAAYREALDLDPSAPAALIGLGRVIADRGQAHAFEAVSLMRRFLESDESTGRDAAAARRVIDDLRERFGQSTLASNSAARRGRDAVASGLWDDAVHNYEATIEAVPLLLSGRLGLADSYLGRARDAEWRRADVQHAVKAYAAALVVDPRDPRALGGHAEALLHLGDHDRALAEALRVLDDDDADVRAHLVAGSARLALLRLDEAATNFDRAQELSPSAEARFGQARVYELQGRTAAAFAALQDVRETYGVPRHLDAEFEEMRLRVEP